MSISIEDLNPCPVIEEALAAGSNTNELGVYLHNVDGNCKEHVSHKANMRHSLNKLMYNHPVFAFHMETIEFNGKKMPKLYAMAANKGRYSAEVANQILVAYATNLKMKKPKNGCPFYQPSTMCQMMRTLLSAMNDEYGWNFALDTSFNFKGGVTKVISALFRD